MSATELEPGAVFAGYRIERAVARGGMGVVYRAWDEALQRPVAVKVVAPELAGEPGFRERFLRESRLAASLEHPHVLPVHGAGEHEGRLYLVMRLVEGDDLRARLARDGALPAGDVARLARELGSALDAAHERGLVHRDVKPGNVLLGRGGEAYLCDFGLTKPAGEARVTADRDFLGTPAYVAPEQVQGTEVDGRADQYSLACVVYECLAGAAPFAERSGLALLWAHVRDRPAPVRERRPELPAGVDRALGRALAKEPRDRYPSAGAFADALEEALLPDGSRPRRSALRSVLRNGKLVAAAGALLVAAAAAVAGLELTGGGPAPIAVAAGNGLAVVDSETSALADVMALPGGPAQVAAAEGRLWVAGDGVVSAVDPVSREVVELVATDARATDLAAGEGAVWLLDGEAGALLQIDPVYAVVTARIELPGPALRESEGPVPGAVAAGLGGVWVVDGSTVLVRLDPATGEVAAEIELGHPLDGVAVGAGAVWAISGRDATVAEVDPQQDALVAEVPIAALPGSAAPYPIAVTVGEGSVWTLNGNTATVTRIDPEIRGVTATIPIGVGRDPTALASGAGAVWVANAADGTLARVDAGTHAVTSVLVGSHPADLAVERGEVWVGVDAGLGSGPVHDVQAIVEASTPAGALPASFCSPVYSLRGQEPRYLIVSDLWLQGDLSLLAAQMSDAIRFVLAERGYRAGSYTIGYQSCDAASAETGIRALDKCAANARAYAAHPKVLAVVGPFDSGCGRVGIPIANTAPDGPLAMLSPTNTEIGLTRADPGGEPGDPESLYPTGERNYARLIPTEDYQAAAAAQLAEQLGLRGVYVLHTEDVYGDLLARVFEHAAGRLGVAVAGRAIWDDGSSTYAELAESVASSGADGVYLAGYRDVDLIRALRAALGASVRIMAPDSFLPVAALVSEARRAAEGMTVSTLGPPPERLAGRGKEFVTAFGEAIGGPVEPFAVYAAAATEVLLDAIARSDGTRASVTANLLGTRSEDGILGETSFDENGDIARRAVTIYEIRDGRREVLDVVVPPDELVRDVGR